MERGSPATDGERVASCLARVVVRKGKIEIHLKGENPSGETNEQAAPVPIIVPWLPQPTRRRREVIRAEGDTPTRPIRSETRARLVDGIARARRWLNDLIAGRAADTHQIAEAAGLSERSVRMTLNLAFLSPAIVKAAVDGTLPDGAGVSQLTEAPHDWTRQMTVCV